MKTCKLSALLVGWSVIASTPTATRSEIQITFDGRYAMDCPYAVKGACKDLVWELNERHRKRGQAEVDAKCPSDSQCLYVDDDHYQDITDWRKVR